MLHCFVFLIFNLLENGRGRTVLRFSMTNRCLVLIKFKNKFKDSQFPGHVIVTSYYYYYYYILVVPRIELWVSRVTVPLEPHSLVSFHFEHSI
jgi:hypothetical protein